MKTSPLSQTAVGGSLALLEISSHLETMGYPKKGLHLIRNCGSPSNLYMTVECGCGIRPINLLHACNRSFCPNCAPKRKRRLYRRLSPFLNFFRRDPTYDYRFLTIKPLNFQDLVLGKKQVRKSFQKFIRRSYIKDRIKGGFYVMEVTNHGNGWNIHIHAIVYSRHLDNVYRGDCKNCHQTYLKKDQVTQNFYCANRSCNQIFEGIPKPSRMQSEFSLSSGRPCFVDLSRVKSSSSVLNYALKYISSFKDSFDKIEDFAFSISKSYHDRVINAFGEFYDFNKKIKINSLKPEFICPRCDEVFRYSFDIEVSRILSQRSPDPPPDLLQYLINVA